MAQKTQLQQFYIPEEQSIYLLSHDDAKKLKDCNVFGVSSDECLNYALANRREWESRGQQVVEELKEMVA